jgi:hypothetical protein
VLQSASPDEVALVGMAESLGLRLVSRTEKALVL